MVELTVLRKGTKRIVRTVQAKDGREAWQVRKDLHAEFNMKKHRIEIS